MSYNKKTIIDILIKRDDMTKDEAEKYVNEMLDVMYNSDWTEWEDIFEEYVGLEPDYLFGLVCGC